ncbi:MAG: phage minor head protein [Rhodanobacter sp.]
MDAEEAARRFAAAAKAQTKALPKVQRDVLAEIIRQLALAEGQVIALLSASPSDAAQRRLRQLQVEIERTMEDFRQAATTASTRGASEGWQAGIRSISAPFDAAGVSALGARIDAGALMATQKFMTDRIQDISLRALNRLNGALTQHIIGATPLADTITQVQKIMGGVPRARAMTVAYTEIGAVHSVSQDAALQQAGHVVPHVRKRWLKSGKLHPRPAHVAAHGQIRRYDEAYVVDGEQLQFPRDPNGSARNVINCGCLSIPVVDGSSFADRIVRLGPQGGVHTIAMPR